MYNNYIFDSKTCNIVQDSNKPDVIKYEVPECTIVWNHGETTYLKGKNALRIARHWLYTDPDCLLVYTAGWIYLKGGDNNDNQRSN